MASNIKFKRSAVQNRVPTTSQLDLGELALNTYDGKLYTEINTGSAAVIEIGSKLSSLVVDGDNGAGGGDVVFHGTTAGRDLTWDFSDNSLKLADNVVLKIGDNSGSGDMWLYHDTSNSYIRRYGSGNLRLTTSSGKIQFQKHGTDTLAEFNVDGSIDLYYDNNLRIATTDDGADILGTGSLKIPVGTTAQRSSSPTAGDLRYNTTTSSFEGYSTTWGDIGAGGVGIGSTSTNPSSGVVGNRIGVGFTDINIVGTGVSVTGYGTTIVIDFNDFKPGSFHRTIHNYTATAGQTTFAGLNYEISEKQIAVYLNGARLSEATYTATSGTTVVLDVGASVGDEVEIINIHTNSDVDRKVNTYTATAGQTTFTGLSYNSKQELDVYLNGIRLASADYTATSGSTVVLAVGASVNDIVDIVSTGDGVTFRSTSDASGDRFTFNNVGIGTDQTPDALNVRGNVNVVGILTVGSSSVTLDGSNNVVNVGTALTIGHTQGVQFHTQNLHAAGFAVNNINASGIITASSFVGDGSNLSNTGSTLSEPSSGTQRIVTTSLTTGTMTSSGVGSELAFDYANNELEFSDNTKASFGTGGDLAIYHNGSHSFIDDTGTGNLKLRSNNFRVSNADESKISATFVPSGSVELFENNVKKAETTSDGFNVEGTLHANEIDMDDNHKIKLGLGDDLEIFHQGTGSFILNHTGNLILSNMDPDTNNEIHLRARQNEQSIVCKNDGAVELYHDNSKKFETGSYGFGTNENIRLNVDNGSIQFGAGQDLKIYHDGTNDRIDSNGTFLILEANNHIFRNPAGNEDYAKFLGNGAVELYHDNTKKFETTSSGAKVFGDLVIDGNLTNEDVTTISSVGIITAQNGINVTGGNINLGDSANTSNHRIFMGADNDMFMYHNGTHGVITNTTGNLHILDDSIKLQNSNGTTRLEVHTSGATVTGTLTATTFSGSGANLTSIPAGQLTGISSLVFNGSNITNVNAATVGGIAAGSFLRSDANDSASGQITLTYSSAYPLNINNSNNGKLVLQGSNDPYIRFREGSTDKAYIQWASAGSFQLVNQESGEYLRIKSGANGLTFTHDGTESKVFHAGNDGSGSGLDADTLDGIEGVNLLRSDTSDTMSGTLTVDRIDVTGGHGIDNESWFRNDDSGDGLYNTGTGQHFYSDHDDYWNIAGGSSANGLRFRDEYAGTIRGYVYANNSNQVGFLDSGGNWILRNTSAGITKLGSNGYQLVNGNNANNLYIYSGTSAATGISMFNSSSQWRFQIYGDGSAYGFLDSNWGGWDIRKYINGQLKVRIDTGSTDHTVWCAGNDGSGSGLDADTVDGLQGSQFVRSDTSDTVSGAPWQLTNSGTSGWAYLFKNNTGTNNYVYMAHGTHGVHIRNDSAGTNQYLLDVYASNGNRFQVRGGDAYTTQSGGMQITGTLTSARVHVSANSDIRLSNGSWTGDYSCKIQHHSNYLYIQGGSNGHIFRRHTGANAWHIDGNGHFFPATNDAYDIGTNGNRVRNLYTTDLQLSNESKKDEGGNDVDGTWGDWTLQEGEDKIFMINNRTGKKYSLIMKEED